jgi:hypothetical protein
MKNQFVSLSIGLAVSCLTLGIISPAFAQSGNGSDTSGATVTSPVLVPGATTDPSVNQGPVGTATEIPILLAAPGGLAAIVNALVNAPPVVQADLPPAIQNLSPDPNAGQLPPGQVAQVINGTPAGAFIAGILNISTGGGGQGGVASQIASLNQTPTGAAVVSNATALGLSLQGLVQSGRVNGLELLKAVQAYNALITAAASDTKGVAGSLNAERISNIRNTLAPLVAAAIQQAQGSQ